MRDLMSPLSKDATLLRCCYLYYQEDMGIQEIGQQLGISRFRVSRYLKEARERGIVQIQIRDPKIKYEQVALQLERTFALSRAVVVATPYDPDPDATRLAIGQAATCLFCDLRPDTSIGITWGRTIAYMVRELPPNACQAERVVELVGGFGQITSTVSARAVALWSSEKLKAECTQLPAPIICESDETARSLLAESSVRQTLTLAAQCDMAVVGVAPLAPSSLLFQAGYLSEDDLDDLIAANAVGSILGRFFDANGYECDTKFRTRAISLTFDAYLQIPERIVLAGGYEKVQGILGLIRGGLITTLVTDSDTAIAVLEANERR
jgi:deoxyribonucleoside regulator